MMMKRLLSALLAAGLLIANSFGASAFFVDSIGDLTFINGTHRWLIDRSFEILGNEKPAMARWYGEKARDIIREYTDWPDQYEKGDDFANRTMGSWHSYRPKEGVNTLGKKDETANTRLVFWYNEAVSKYKAGQKDESFRALGKATHYLGDMASPPHTGERSYWILSGVIVYRPLRIAFNGASHLTYEAAANTLKDFYAVQTGGLYHLAMQNSVKQIGHKTALFSLNYYYIIEDSEIFRMRVDEAVTETRKGNGLEQRSIKEPLEYAQKILAGLLYRFYHDCAIV